MSEPFLAEVRIVGFNFAPIGWARCDGQILSISSNTALFSLLGTTYGGNGTTTFALPDLRGRLPTHQGTGPGLSARTIGEKSGVETVTLTVAQMPAHGHPFAGGGGSASIPSTSAVGNQTSPNGNLPARANDGESNYSNAAANGAIAAALAGNTGNTGGGQAHTNLPPYLTMNFVIAMQGIYPSPS